MGKCYNSITIPAPTSEVWVTLRNLHDMSWAEGVITSCVAVGDTPADQVGAKRVLNDAFHEKLRSIDDAARRLTCTIDDGPGPVSPLFGIGLELSLDRVRRLWRLIILGGGLQVAATVLVVLALSLLLGGDARSGLMLGFIIAVSSTAIVLRGLSTRGELEAPHGRLALGILVFQDLCVVPMVLVIPLLGDTGVGARVWMPLLTAGALVAGALVAARFVVPRFLDVIARTRQRELFVLSVFLICLGSAWVVSSAGVSLALGAFLAGLVVSDSRYREQAISDLVPLRDVLTSVFFVAPLPKV